jgi:transcriptional regulator with XRE-family HTH domain
MRRIPEGYDFALTHARKLRGWTRAHVARQLGLPYGLLSDFERGRKQPTPEMMTRLWRFLTGLPETR